VSDGFEKIERAESIALSDDCLSQLSEKIVGMVDSKIASSLELNLEKAVSVQITQAMNDFAAKTAANDKKKAAKKLHKKNAKRIQKDKKNAEIAKALGNAEFKAKQAQAEMVEMRESFLQAKASEESEKTKKLEKKEATKEYLKKLKAQKKDAFKKKDCDFEFTMTESKNSSCSSISKLRNKLAALPEATELAVHGGFICDACNIGPIIGTRFKCFECGDYDLCSDCEPFHHRHHLMLRIPAPENFTKLLKGTNGYHEMALDLDVPEWKPEVVAEKKVTEPEVKAVEVGPIWSHNDFLARKAEFANTQPGWEMTGHWTTTVPGKMSVVQYRKVAEPVVEYGKVLIGADMIKALPEMKSGSKDLSSVDMLIKNMSGSTVNTFWINYKQNPTHYSEIPAGKQVNQQTYTSHQWIFTHMNGTFGSYVPTFTEEQIADLKTVEVVIDQAFEISVKPIWSEKKVIVEAEPEVIVEVAEPEVELEIVEVEVEAEVVEPEVVAEVVEPEVQAEVVEPEVKAEVSQDEPMVQWKTKQLMEIFDGADQATLEATVRENPEMALENLVVVVLALY